MSISEEDLNEFQTYTSLEETEVGSTCASLLSLTECQDYISDEFYEALQKEIYAQLDNFKKNAKIVKRMETYTQEYTELEWIYPQ